MQLKKMQQHFYWKCLNETLQEEEFTQVIRIDFAGLKMGPCEKWYELVGVEILPNREEPKGKPVSKIRYEYNHFILPVEKKKTKAEEALEEVNIDQLDDAIASAAKKDVDFTAKCLEQWMKRILRPTTKRLLVFSDGGSADFKNSKFENFLLSYQIQVNENRNTKNELKIEHHIFAPNHGQGICDTAHSHGAKKLKIWALENDKIIEKPNEVASVIGSVKNHSAFVVFNDQAFEDVYTFTGISQCYAFRFDSTNAKVLGYENSESKVVLKGWSPKPKVARKY